MTEQDMQELNAIIQHLGPAIQQAVGNGVLHALRTHSEEQSAKLEPLVFGEVHNTKPKGEVPGEREVWAQAYAIAFRNGAGKGEGSAALADVAVQAFRERYK